MFLDALCRTSLPVGLSCRRTSRKALRRYRVCCKEPLTCGLGSSARGRSLAREALRLQLDAELVSTLGRSNILSSMPGLCFICLGMSASQGHPSFHFQRQRCKRLRGSDEAAAVKSAARAHAAGLSAGQGQLDANPRWRCAN